jgi:hypothetical protein
LAIWPETMILSGDSLTGLLQQLGESADGDPVALLQQLFG